LQSVIPVKRRAERTSRSGREGVFTLICNMNCLKMGRDRQFNVEMENFKFVCYTDEGSIVQFRNIGILQYGLADSTVYRAFC
jgi:hypothetical protein